MELKLNDLYSNGEVESYPNGERYLVREPIEYEGSDKDKYHTVKETDTITYIAWLFYKDHVDDASKYWWAIADVNEIFNPLDLSDLIGEEILIPDILLIQLKQ